MKTTVEENAVLVGDNMYKKVLPENGTSFTYDELSKILNCKYVEGFPLTKDLVMIMDDNPVDKEVNADAVAYLQKYKHPFFPIRGRVLVTPRTYVPE